MLYDFDYSLYLHPSCCTGSSLLVSRPSSVEGRIGIERKVYERRR